jgi:hypothetical protein
MSELFRTPVREGARRLVRTRKISFGEFLLSYLPRTAAAVVVDEASPFRVFVLQEVALLD